MTSIDPTRDIRDADGSRLRLTTGIELLHAWWETAGDAERDIVSDALFALLGGSVYTDYEVIDDPEYPRELVIVVLENLAIRARLHDAATFGIVFIGQPVDALAPSPGDLA